MWSFRDFIFLKMTRFSMLCSTSYSHHLILISIVILIDLVTVNKRDPVLG